MIVDIQYLVIFVGRYFLKSLWVDYIVILFCLLNEKWENADPCITTCITKCQHEYGRNLADA